MKRLLGPWAPQLLSMLRIVFALLFLEHGTAKLFQFPYVEMFAHVEIGSLLGVAGIIELVGGALVAVGLFTRVAAFVLSGQMAFAYFMAHETQGVFPILNGGEGAILYCFAFLYIAAAGAGPISLDRILRRDD